MEHTGPVTRKRLSNDHTRSSLLNSNMDLTPTKKVRMESLDGSIAVKNIYPNLKPSSDNDSPKSDKSQDQSSTKKYETCKIILARRQKQIDYGYNNEKYKEYVEALPKEDRSPTDPQTPNKNHRYTRRGWDMLIKLWRKDIHMWHEIRQDLIESENDDKSGDEEGETGSVEGKSPSSDHGPDTRTSDDNDDRHSEKKGKERGGDEYENEGVNDFIDDMLVDHSSSTTSANMDANNAKREIDPESEDEIQPCWSSGEDSESDSNKIDLYDDLSVNS